MKKLNKLEINSEKIMKNEELIALRGGYDCWDCEVYYDGQYISQADCCCGDCTPPQASQICTEMMGGPPYEVDCGCK